MLPGKVEPAVGNGLTPVLAFDPGAGGMIYIDDKTRGRSKSSRHVMCQNLAAYLACSTIADHLHIRKAGGSVADISADLFHTIGGSGLLPISRSARCKDYGCKDKALPHDRIHV